MSENSIHRIDPQPAEDESPRSRMRESVAHATERIQEIIDTAERVAEEIQRDAAAEAERHLAERRRDAERLALEQAECLETALAGVRGHLTRLEADGARLLAELERLLGELTGGATSTRAQAEPPNSLPAKPPPSQPQPAERVPGELHDAALIRATQMAVSGSERAEIEAALHDELGVPDPAPLVDQVLGR